MNSRFIGRYKIERELGRGGMAVVYLARDPAIDRQVAIKLLPSQYTADPHFLARFRREAEIVANLEHPGIVPVYDFGEHDDQPFIVMRYMPGGSLARRLNRGAIPVAESARIFGRLAPALDSAHAKGFIHRDLKPANILFDQYDEPYLADFGIVKLMESSETALTAAGGIVGTPAYMSPEQVRGKGELDGHSDIYALGAILFEMLTGRQPYEADTPMGLALKHIREPVPRILDVSANVPAGSQAVVNKAMAKEPDDRYATAGDLSAAINTLASRGPMTAGETTATSMATQIDVAHPATPGDRLVAGAGRWKRPWLFVLAAVGLFICIAVVASVFFFRGLRNGVRAGADPAPDDVVALAGTADTVVPEKETLTPVATAKTRPATAPSVEPTDSPAPTQTAVPPTVTPSVNLTSEPSPSPTEAPGRIVYQSNRDGDFEIFVMDVDGSNETQLTYNSSQDKFPAVSPNGRQIAFQSERDGNWEIYVMDMNGGNQRRLTMDPAHDRLPTWSPDGASLAFNSDRDGDFEIYTMATDGGNLRQVTFNNLRVGHPSWSVDDWLVFNIGTNELQSWEIMIVDLDTGEQRQLTHNNIGDWSPEWSPDGNTILFLSERNGSDPSIYAMNRDGSNSRLLYTSGQYDWAARWSSDGRRIIFTTDINNLDHVFIMEANGSAVQELSSGGSYPAWVCCGG